MNSEHLEHDLFLLMLTLSQLRGRDRIVSVFIEALNSSWDFIGFVHEEGIENQAESAIPIETFQRKFGCLTLTGDVARLAPDEHSLIRNAARLLAVILENRTQEVLLEDENLRLESLVQERAEELLRANAHLQEEITSRQRAEEMLDRFFQVSIDLMCVLDRHGRYQYMNPAFTKTLGYDLEDLLSKYYLDFVHPDDREFTENAIRQLADGQPAINFENRYRTAIGDFKWLAWTAQPDPRTGLTYVVARDITEDKRREQERIKLEAQLKQAQRMESIGTLAGGIAHDFNNILSPIMGFSEMLLEDKGVPESAQNKLQAIMQAAHRARELVRHILAFSRQTKRTVQPLRLQEILEEVLQLSRSSLPSTISLHKRIDPYCGPIMADPTEIHQITMNLVTNAFHAMEETGGKLEVALSEISLSREDMAGFSLEPGAYARLTVADTGMGMNQTVMDRIFDPYFSTKEKGKGTGLGLAVVHGIVKSYQGEVKVYSEQGQGTTFHVLLPVFTPGVHARHPEAAQKVLKGSERILLVDDEQSVITIEKKMLERLGYTVTAFTNSLEALQSFQARSRDYDLVMTDLTMPHLTGDQLARELMQIRPDIPVVVCTGFSETFTPEKAQHLGICGFLFKPLVRSELSQTIRKALDGRS